jgi:hypothetical protein
LISSVVLQSSEDLSYIDKFIEGTDEYRKNIHKTFMNISSSLDDYVSDEKINQEEYHSTYALLELRVYQTQHEKVRVIPKVKIRLKLPKLKNKFRLEFESEDTNKKKDFMEDENNKNDYNLGLGYLKRFKNFANIHTKIGIKLRRKLDPFITINLYKTLSDIKTIDYTLGQNIKLSYLNELELTTSLILIKHLSNSYSLQQSNEYYWKSKTKEENEFSSSLSLNHKIDNHNSIRYSLNASINNIDSNLKLKRYSLKSNYRHLIKDWLYTDVILENFYKEDENFKPRYAIGFNLGMYINRDSYKN